MNSISRETLRRVEQNDNTLFELRIGETDDRRYELKDNERGKFNSSDGNDFARFGTAIGENTHIEEVDFCGNALHDTKTNNLLEGLKRNKSIKWLKLTFQDRSVPVGEVPHKLLSIYQENNNLNRLNIHHANLNRGELCLTLQSCTNLTSISLNRCNITSEQLSSIIEPIKCSLERLHLYKNGIGNACCDALASLLRDPFCNLHDLSILEDNISNVGAISIANSLAHNTKLQELVLCSNQIDHRVNDSYSRLLCNATSIDSICASNHTLEKLTFERRNGFFNQPPPQHLVPLLMMNKGTNKCHAVIKKILRYHPNIDMVPLFQLDIEEEDRSLKGLPYAISWFDKASAAVVDDRERNYFSDSDDSADWVDSYDYHVEEQKLSAIYQFAQAMPMLFVPISHRAKTNGVNQPKRKYSASRLSSGGDSDDSLLSQSDDDDKVVALGSKKMKTAGWKNDTNPKRYTTEDIDREIAMYKEQSDSSDDDN